MLHTFCTAPVLRDQQERYRKTESRLKELSNQLDVVNSKFEEEQAKRQEMQRRAGYYQRASDRLKQTCSDLSRQVNIFAFFVGATNSLCFLWPQNVTEDNG